MHETPVHMSELDPSFDQNVDPALTATSSMSISSPASPSAQARLASASHAASAKISTM